MSKAQDLAVKYMDSATWYPDDGEKLLAEFYEWLVTNGKVIDLTECRCRTIKMLRQQQDGWLGPKPNENVTDALKANNP